MSIIIIKPGILDTIQDLGRTGYGASGINPGGAMDRFAVKLGNMLAGNDAGEGVIELHFPGPQILFEQDALVCITGADFSPTCNDEPIPCWQPVLIRKNTVMQFSKVKWGARAYLTVNGGFRIDRWLNSYSTNLKAGAGGYEGRRLEKKDELFFKAAGQQFSGIWKVEDNFQPLPWRPDIREIYHEPHNIYFIRGHEWNELSAEVQVQVLQENFTIQPFSDRMGYQLKGAPISRIDNTEIISAAVAFGTIQLLPNGQLIVLMADHQTTGGYPRIGHVISAHLPKLAQCTPGEAIHLKAVGIDAAEELIFYHHRELQILQRACADRLKILYA